MQGKVHVAIGVATTACLCLKYPQGIEVAGMMFLPEIGLLSVTAGSYAPDIDMGTTHAGREHKIASKLVSKFGGGHRGITHTLLVPFILTALLIFLNTTLGGYKYLMSLIVSIVGGFLLGWVMHIFADLFNGKGCPLLWPISFSKISIMDLPSSGIVPWIFAVVYTAVILFFTIGGFSLI